jgi:amino acid transporter
VSGSPAPDGAPGSPPVRQLGLFTVLCIGVNNIVGSGIFKKPSTLAAQMHEWSWVAFAICGVLLTFVALCFSVLATRHDETGGPYVYARRAFGPWVAFAVAWTAWISMWAAAGGVAVAVPDYLAVFVPGANGPVASKAAALALIAALTLVNCVGVKPAAGTSTFLTVAKVVPLLVFVAIGLAHLDRSRVALAPPSFDAASRSALGAGLFAAFFPLQGFEVVPVPAGELKNPRRDVPISVTGALLLSAGLYCLIQLVAYSTCPAIALPSGDAHDRPIAEAAATFLGGFGRNFVAAGALASTVGFAAVTILCAPRFLVALGGDGLLPAAFARTHRNWGTPVVAVLATCVPAAAAVFLPGDTFDLLTNLSNVAVLVQYVATCLAVVVLLRDHGPLVRFVLPALGLAACGVLAWLVGFDPQPWLEVAVFGAWLVVGLALALLARAHARRTSNSPVR